MNIAEILNNHPVFSKLSVKQKKSLQSCGKNVIFNAGQIVLDQFQIADKFYILCTGHVLLQSISPKNKTIKIQTLSRHDILGWSWLVPPFKWHFEAEALEKTEAIEFDGNAVKRLMENDHEFGYFLLKEFLPIIVGRLQAARLQKIDIYGDHV